MNNSSKQSKPFNNLKLSKFYFLLVFSTLFFIHFFNLATQAKALEFDPEDPHLEDEAKTRKENQEVMWGPVFNTPDHTLTKWDGDFKVVKTATETPNNLLLLTSRAYDAQNNLLWGHEDTWDRTYNKNFNVLGKKNTNQIAQRKTPKLIGRMLLGLPNMMKKVCIELNNFFIQQKTKLNGVLIQLGLRNVMKKMEQHFITKPFFGLTAKKEI
ncbi:MAG: putative secreted protein [Candidatus Phytoplasma asteris]|nr:MAG: putative secreted protein [Periwinkle leaf yellowing phytoplasma]WEX19814.1 MAG: putative secreted protein [Candidatus Phytoplasma asteris]